MRQEAGPENRPPPPLTTAFGQGAAHMVMSSTSFIIHHYNKTCYCGGIKQTVGSDSLVYFSGLFWDLSRRVDHGQASDHRQAITF